MSVVRWYNGRQCFSFAVCWKLKILKFFQATTFQLKTIMATFRFAPFKFLIILKSWKELLFTFDLCFIFFGQNLVETHLCHVPKNGKSRWRPGHDHSRPPWPSPWQSPSGSWFLRDSPSISHSWKMVNKQLLIYIHHLLSFSSFILTFWQVFCVLNPGHRCPRLNLAPNQLKSFFW